MKLYYKRNSANAICDVCGFKFKLNELKKRWDGLWVCESDWEMRHPMDFIRGRKEIFDLPVTKPRPTDTFVNPPYIFYKISVVDFAIVDYSIVDNLFGLDILKSTIPTMNDGTSVPGYAIADLAIVDRNNLFVQPGYNSYEGS